MGISWEPPKLPESVRGGEGCSWENISSKHPTRTVSVL